LGGGKGKSDFRFELLPGGKGERGVGTKGGTTVKGQGGGCRVARVEREGRKLGE